MSGFEVAGVLLGVFPLIISGLEHWRETAKVGGFFWRVRKEFHKCRVDVQYHQLWYRRNLTLLLLPIANDADEVSRLIGDPGGEEWSGKALQERLERRLQESFYIYMEVIREMEETVQELRKELSLDNATVQSKLASPESKKQWRPSNQQRPSKLAAAKSKLDYEAFRVKFSFNAQVRSELFDRLKGYNEQLETLLDKSDKVSALQKNISANMKRNPALETVLKRAWKKSDLLYKALRKSWQCSCQQHHFANLRLEHRTLPDISFEVILAFVAPSSQTNVQWSWRELHAKPYNTHQSSRSPNYISASVLSTEPARRKMVAFAATTSTTPDNVLDIPVGSMVALCQLLGEKERGMCIIDHDDETYQLHPLSRKRWPGDSGLLTLGYILSSNFERCLTRRQRYLIALVLASSVAQLQFTSWLRTGLTKEDVIFFVCEDDDCSILYHEPFIRQGFLQPTPKTEVDDCNFFSLGIVLLELCFGQRLEDCPLRKRYPAEAGEAKQALDLKAALKWVQYVADEGGDNYASAVKWCFTATVDASQSWRGEIIRNVIKPLEMCQEHFKAVAVS